MEVLFCMSLLSKNLVINGSIIPPGNENVKKGKVTLLLTLHTELDGI